MKGLLFELKWRMSLWLNRKHRRAWKRWVYAARPLRENQTGRAIPTELSANPELSRRLFIQRHREMAEYLRQHDSRVDPYKVLLHLTVFWWDYVQSTESGEFHYYPTSWILESAREPDKSRLLDDSFRPIMVSRMARFDW